MAIARHGECGKQWWQAGNRTGHCGACHETFEGLALFDAHQRRSPEGSAFCAVPAEMEYPKGWPLKQDGLGTWSTTKPHPKAAAA